MSYVWHLSECTRHSEHVTQWPRLVFWHPTLQRKDEQVDRPVLSCFFFFFRAPPPFFFVRRGEGLDNWHQAMNKTKGSTYSNRSGSKPSAIIFPRNAGGGTPCKIRTNAHQHFPYDGGEGLGEGSGVKWGQGWGFVDRCTQSRVRTIRGLEQKISIGKNFEGRPVFTRKFMVFGEW